MRLGFSGAAVLLVFAVLYVATEEPSGSADVEVTDASCEYLRTDDAGYHLFRLQAEGIAEGPGDAQVRVSAAPVDLPMLLACEHWGERCLRDPGEHQKTAWRAMLELGSPETTYEAEIRAGTRASRRAARSAAGARERSTIRSLSCEVPEDAWPRVAEAQDSPEAS